MQNYVDQLYICFPIKDIKTYYQNFLNSMVWQASERRGREGVREWGREGEYEVVYYKGRGGSSKI